MVLARAPQRTVSIRVLLRMVSTQPWCRGGLGWDSPEESCHSGLMRGLCLLLSLRESLKLSHWRLMPSATSLSLSMTVNQTEVPHKDCITAEIPHFLMEVLAHLRKWKLFKWRFFMQVSSEDIIHLLSDLGIPCLKNLEIQVIGNYFGS